MARMSLELSDGIDTIRRHMEDYTHEAQVLDPEQARVLVRCLRHVHQLARNLENEISRRRWNEAAREERETSAVLDELARPGTNVRLFPVIGRQFGDPGGAA